MVFVKEEAHSRRVRMFRWNEKLRKNRISDWEGMFVYFITSKFTTINSDTDIEVEERRLQRAIRFDLTGLLTHDSIKSMPHTVLSATNQFLPETIVPLGDEISDYLLKHFDFCLKKIFGPKLPKIVIVAEIYRVRTVDHTDIDLNLSPTAPMLPPTPPLGDSDSDSDSSIAHHYVDYDTDEVEDDPSESYSKDVLFYWAILREGIGEKKYFATRAIATDEPRGLVEVEPVRLFLAEAAEFRRRGKCLICLDELATPTEVTITSCSHVFHTRCIFDRVWKKNSCPTCRKPWPLF